MSRVAYTLVLLTLAGPAFATDPVVIRSAKSGPWSDPATWNEGQVPAAGARVLVAAGHAVTYDVKADAVIRSVHVSGTLAFAPNKDTVLNVGLLKVQPGDSTDENGFDCDAHIRPDRSRPRAALHVGTPDRPIDSDKTAVIRLHAVAGLDPQSCPAVVCCGGRMEFHGAPMSRTWVKLGATVPDPKKRKPADDASRITVAELVTGWRVGDRVIITSTAKGTANDHARSTFRAGAAASGLGQYAPQTEERIVTAIDGATLTLDRPLVFGHRGADDYRGEVANLSRNVVVESADPAGVRGHTMYHRHSAGSISYAEFRHLGKEGALGRYALHFHLCGDTMRGSSVVGASVWDSHNRWLTVHGTEYMVVRDCVGYQAVGHGFFLEDGTETLNVFDRNLAVQAFRGRPLPGQMLPGDKNEGAGFWWANSRNTFTRNVAAECDEYGFRFEATPRAGAVVGRERFGDPTKSFDLRLPVRQPDGSRERVDVRTLPFVRFERNEAHSMHNYELNLGEGAGGVGPPAATPFVIRDLTVWHNRLGYRPAVPHVLVETARLTANTYGIYQPEYVGHDYRHVSWGALDGTTPRVRRMPGDQTTGDGRGRPKAPEVEVARLDPVDTLPPATVVTSVRTVNGKRVVRGTTADDGAVKRVVVNGREAAATAPNFAEWEVELPAGTAAVTAHAEDAAGNVEKTPHTVPLPVR